MSPAAPAGIAVLLEQGRSRCFASSVDWPGWARAGRTPETALEALAGAADRYRPVALAAGARFPARASDPHTLTVVETVPGNATTDFGAPGVPCEGDALALTAAQARRQVALLRAAWTNLDQVAAVAPAALRKGPRGGGRDRDEVLRHVAAAEAAYARKAGVRRPTAEWEDPRSLPACRESLAAALDQAATGEPLAPQGWTARYALRRIAWHVLDHAWEIEDRSEPAPR